MRDYSETIISIPRKTCSLTAAQVNYVNVSLAASYSVTLRLTLKPHWLTEPSNHTRPTLDERL